MRWQLWVAGIATLVNVAAALPAYTCTDRNLVFGVKRPGLTFATLES